MLSLVLLVDGPIPCTLSLPSYIAWHLHCCPLSQGDRLFPPVSVLMEGASLHPLDLG